MDLVECVRYDVCMSVFVCVCVCMRHKQNLEMMGIEPGSKAWL